MRKSCFLSLALIFALFCNSTVFAFHVPPWDTGHNSFQGDGGDNGTDPGTGDGCNSCPCTSKTASPVEAASGNFIYNMRALSVSGLGPTIDLTLTYNSQDLRRGPFGAGWVHPYEQRIIETTDEVKIYAICSQSNGKRERFTRNQDGSYTPPPHVFATLTKNTDKTFTLSDKSGLIRRFNDQGLLTAIVDRNGNTLRLLYDATGFMTQITDASGRSVNLTKGADGRVESVTDPAGKAFRFGYDASGNLTRYTDPLGNVSTYQYDAGNNLTAVVDPRGNTLMRVTYDSAGRVSQHVDGAETWTYSYSPSTSRTTKRDSLGNIWTLDFNANGNLTKTTDPFGKSEQYVVDASLNVTQFTDKNGNITKYTYDSFGNQLTITDALNNVRTMTYESSFNRPLTVRDALGNTAKFEYDAKGNMTRITDALGRFTSLTYDSRGLLTKVTDALGQATTFEYDAYGNLTRTTDPLGNQPGATFDILGRLLTTTDAEGRTTSFTYDDADRLIRTVNTLSGATSYEYDASGNLTATTTPSGARTSLAYDSLDRLISVTNPLGQIETYVYDRRSNVATKQDPKGQSITYTHDALDRLTKKSQPDDTVNYTYDAMGNLLTVADSDSSLTFIYDALNRLTETRTGATAVQPASTVRYSYNANGKRSTMTDPKGGVTTYAYDALSRLTSVSDPGPNTFTFAYDALSRRTGVSRPSGLNTTYAYDAGGRLTNLVHTGGPGTLQYSYTYNRTGQRNSLTDNSGSHTYLYDGLYRLVNVVHPLGNPTETYSYDAVGNRTASQLSASYTHNAANRLTADAAFDYVYDANGNLIQKTERATGKITRYSFDSENRLIKIDFPDGGTAAYFYDGMGRRIEKNFNGTITQQVYDGNDVVAEYTGGAVSSQFTYGPGIDEVLSVRQGTLTAFFQSDVQGTVTRVVKSDGTQLASYVYDSFGRIVSETGTRLSRYAFQGRELDAESGLYYFRARYYDPTAGRFLTEDPNPLTRQLNNYTFVENDPVNLLDPLGLDWLENLSNFSAGFGDNLTFGLTSKIRDWMGTNDLVDRCSGYYKAGEWSGVALTLASGIAGGIKLAGAKGVGREFSHWIPNRMGGPRSIWNGNYVSSARHYFHDPFRYPIGWRELGPKWNPFLQQLDRIPNVYKGGAAGAAYGGASKGSNSSNNCECK
jgi:RHS repeat-associated protein